MMLVQLTFTSVGRLPLAPDEASRRRLLHAIGRVAAGVVVLFALVDDHLHLAIYCEETRIGALSRSLLLALRAVVGVNLNAAHRSPIRDRAHLETLVRYFLTQPAHHGLAEHPALTTGSCFAELVGARVVPGLALRLSAMLPRYRLRAAYAHVGLPEAALALPSADAVRRAGAFRVAAAAGAAAGRGPVFDGNAPLDVDARTAAVHVARANEVDLDELAHVLAITPRALRRIAERPPPLPLVSATRMRLALEDAATAAALSRAGELRA
ncbi:MAG: hypothetical protein Q8P18_09645 [Pseudomonadota bacterium]|nr:hypothetical protein [Pseudomonadota bacterium]